MGINDSRQLRGLKLIFVCVKRWTTERKQQKRVMSECCYVLDVRAEAQMHWCVCVYWYMRKDDEEKCGGSDEDDGQQSIIT